MGYFYIQKEKVTVLDGLVVKVDLDERVFCQFPDKLVYEYGDRFRIYGEPDYDLNVFLKSTNRMIRTISIANICKQLSLKFVDTKRKQKVPMKIIIPDNFKRTIYSPKNK